MGTTHGADKQCRFLWPPLKTYSQLPLAAVVHGTEGREVRWHRTGFHRPAPYFPTTDATLVFFSILPSSLFLGFSLAAMHLCLCSQPSAPSLLFPVPKKKEKGRRAERFGWAPASEGPTSQCNVGALRKTGVKQKQV